MADLSHVNLVLLTLRQARLSRSDAAAHMVKDLTQLLPQGSGAANLGIDLAYHAARSAVFELSESLNTPGCFTGRAAWAKAIDAAEAWKLLLLHTDAAESQPVRPGRPSSR